jgi:hypothetical protein
LSILKKILSGSTSKGKILYHYTTQEGLLGILKEQKLRVSSILHLNDAAEFNYTVGLVRTNLKLRLEKKNEPDRPIFNDVLKGLRELEKRNQFVGSFSERGDSLSQWRAYAGNGIGFSLGFEPDHLKRCAENQGYKLRRCNYDEDDHIALIDELVAKLIGHGSRPKFHRKDVAFLFYNDLASVAPLLKHPSFSDEREWRLISRPASEYELEGKETVHFRPGRSMLIPYREFDLRNREEMSLARVIIGPTPHKELSHQSVTNLLRTLSLYRYRSGVKSSVVPYRTW